MTGEERLVGREHQTLVCAAFCTVLAPRPPVAGVRQLLVDTLRSPRALHGVETVGGRWFWTRVGMWLGIVLSSIGKWPGTG